MHPLVFEKDAELAEFRAKGRRYTEDEKQWLLDKQRDLLAQIIPLHRKLAERGPGRADDHALLPPDPAAAASTSSWPARRCPTSTCRAIADGYPEDAEVHVRRAVE